jgi:AcrR family transcriptional regulator
VTDIDRERPEWSSDEPFARRRELYVRAAPVFRKHGYRGATLKALANACGLSIPALYRYFPSKRAFALFPLASLYPELQGPPPDVTVGDPLAHLSGWIEGAVAEMPNYLLAARLAREVGLDDEEQRKVDANLADHLAILGGLARHAGPHLDDRAAQELARAMVNVVMGPALTGLDPEPRALRRELRALLRGYGLIVPEIPRPLD